MTRTQNKLFYKLGEKNVAMLHNHLCLRRLCRGVKTRKEANRAMNTPQGASLHWPMHTHQVFIVRLLIQAFVNLSNVYNIPIWRLQTELMQKTQTHPLASGPSWLALTLSKKNLLTPGVMNKLKLLWRSAWFWGFPLQNTCRKRCASFIMLCMCESVDRS